MSHDDPLFYDSPPKKEEKVDKKPKINKPSKEVQESVEHPVGNIIDLPSKGLMGYPGSISHREIMAGDEEVLQTATNKNFSRTVNRVLKSICNDEDFFDDLYIGDRDYILTHIWANTYDDEKKFEVTCRHCGNRDEKIVDIFKLNSIDIKENFRPRFKLKIKKTDETVQVRVVTVRDENNAEKFLADHPKEELSLDLVQSSLALEFGKPMKTADRVRYFKENVSAKERGIIREYHKYYRFGLDTSYDHTCSECQGVTHGYIPFLPEDIIAPEVRTDFERLLHSDEGSED